MTRGADEFIRRFLLHVLRDGFQRIRYFGFLANPYSAKKCPCAGSSCKSRRLRPPRSQQGYKDRYEALTGISLKACALYRCGTMVVIETFECTSDRASFVDTLMTVISHSPLYLNRACRGSREWSSLATCSFASGFKSNFLRFTCHRRSVHARHRIS
jgi:Putative transposase